MILLLLIAVILLFDLGIKDTIEQRPDSVFPRELEGTKGRVVLRRIHNPGLPMGALARYPQLVIRIPLAVVSAAAGMLACLYPKKGSYAQKAGLAMVIGGGLGNLYDRLVRGYVVDYLNIRFGKLQKIIFNLADVCILAGAVLFAAGELTEEIRRQI